MLAAASNRIYRKYLDVFLHPGGRTGSARNPPDRRSSKLIGPTLTEDDAKSPKKSQFVPDPAAERREKEVETEQAKNTTFGRFYNHFLKYPDMRGTISDSEDPDENYAAALYMYSPHFHRS